MKKLASLIAILFVLRTVVAQDRGIVAEPLPTAQTRGNAGLFVGVNAFTDDPAIRPLRYAVNDAVAQARYFVLQVQLIPARNTRLLLSGDPTAEHAATLRELREAGVSVVPATRSQVLQGLGALRGWAGRPEDFVVVSFSTHGFEQEGVPYVLPSEALLDNLPETALRLEAIERQLDRVPAQKRLLIVDACREMVRQDGRDLGSKLAMTPAFQKALGAAAGRLVLASCDSAQLSYEDPLLAHGVFTAKLLEALSGLAGSPNSEFITLGHVLDYLDSAVPEWIARNKPSLEPELRQRPWFKGPSSARSIPLAVSRDFRRTPAGTAGRREKAIAMVRAAHTAHPLILGKKLADAVEEALRRRDGEALDGILTRVERRLKPGGDEADIEDFLSWWQRQQASTGLAASSPDTATVERIETSIARLARERRQFLAAHVRSQGVEYDPEIDKLVSLAESRQTDLAFAVFQDLSRRSKTADGALHPHFENAAWEYVGKDVGGGCEQYRAMRPEMLWDVGSRILTSVSNGAVFFGGTDFGRFALTMLSGSQAEANPFFTITQNGLASDSYFSAVRTTYGSRLKLPDHSAVAAHFEAYLRDAQSRSPDRLKPGEVVTIVDGRVTVSGQVAVMSINALIARDIFDSNPQREFFVEESFPLEWMYPHLSPAGMVMRVHRVPVDSISNDTIQRDHDYWAACTGRFIGDWIKQGTSIQELCEWAMRVHHRRDLTGFKGDPDYLREGDAKRIVAKLRKSIGESVYAWRYRHSKSPTVRERLSQEAEYALKQAYALCPDQPETCLALVQLLLELGRREDALLIVNTSRIFDPGNVFYRDVITQLSSESVPPTSLGDAELTRLESRHKTNPNNLEFSLELASHYIQLERKSDAGVLLDRVVAAQPTDAGTVLRLADAYRRLNDLTKVEAALLRLTQVAPNLPEAWYDLAAIQVIQGRYRDAASNLEQALRLDSMRRATDASARNLRTEFEKDPRFNAARNRPEFERLR